MDNDKQDGLWYLYASSILGWNYIYNNKMYFPFKYPTLWDILLEFKCILST